MSAAGKRLIKAAKEMRRYRYKDDREAQACVAAASVAWQDTFARYYHIPGTDKVLRIGGLHRTTRLPAPSREDSPHA